MKRFRMMSHEPRTWLIKDRYTVLSLRTVAPTEPVELRTVAP